MKRLIGSIAAFGGISGALTEGFQAIFGTTDAQEKALDRWVAPYEVGDKKLISYEEDENGKKTYYYQNWSANNAYDYLETPFRRILRKVQLGIESEEQLSKGLVKGISDAFSKSMEPFVSESIAPEAIIDIFIRGGETREGKKLYTEQTPLEDKTRIIIKHIIDTQIPLSKSQMTRLFYAYQGLPAPKSGQVYDIEKELPGLLGWRLIKIDPIRGLDFKITGYDKAKRGATREFTGGDARLLAAPATKDEVIRQFFVTNRALFEAQQNMHLDLEAGKEFDVTDDEYAAVFEKRLRSVNEYGPFIDGVFMPYQPSQNIAKKFEEKSQEFMRANPSYKNPFEEALPVIIDMIEKMQGVDLKKEFPFKPSDFGIQEEAPTPGSDIILDSLGEMPQPDPAIVQTAQATPNVMSTGLTPTEQALLSEEERMIALRNRGLA